MDDIFNKVKQSAVKAKDEAEKFTKVAVKKTKEVIDQTKYNYMISGIESKINDILAELGQKIYDEYTEGADFEGTISEKCQDIDNLKKEIAEMKERMAELKNSVICKGCGEIVNEGSVYCPKCGAKLEEE